MSKQQVKLKEKELRIEDLKEKQRTCQHVWITGYADKSKNGYCCLCGKFWLAAG